MDASNRQSSWGSVNPTTSPGRRREMQHEQLRHVPNILTTSLAGQHLSLDDASWSYIPTPISTTSLSGPFSQHLANQSPAFLSASSPMSSRYSAPYNPSEWGPISGSSSQSASNQWTSGTHPQFARPRHSTDDPVASPPPPYSPGQNQPTPNQETRSSTISSGGASTSASASQLRSPTSTSTSVSFESSSARFTTTATTDSPQAQWNPSFPPPPSGSGSRSSSRLTSDRAHGFISSLTGRHRSSQHQNASQDMALYPQSPRQIMSPIDGQIQAPAARRAVSASGIMTTAPASPAIPRADDEDAAGTQSSWAPGMPLPPPPPGPPPAASRSQSASGVSWNSHSSSPSPVDAALRQRQRHTMYGGPSLATIPPTPANYVDEAYAMISAASNQERQVPGPLIDTTNPAVRPGSQPDGDGRQLASPPLSSPPPNRNSTYGLARSTAVRASSSKGIRERRSESRNGKRRESRDLADLSIASPSEAGPSSAGLVRPANLDLRNLDDAVASGDLWSGGHSGTPKSAADFARMGLSPGQASKRPTPRLQTDFSSNMLDILTDTPPFSPSNADRYHQSSRTRSPAVPPKTLPTPPSSQQYSRPPSSSSLYPPSSDSDRPISHLFHLPNEDVSVPAPLTPSRANAPLVQAEDSNARKDDIFFEEAQTRYLQFLDREQKAKSDVERLRLFTDFMVSESGLRRRRYAEVWDQAAIDLDIVRDRLFSRQRAASRRGSGLRLNTIQSPTSPSSSSRPEGQWWSHYQPMLSPIAASMSNGGGAGADEMSSRGRAPSRWWESQTGSSEGGSRRMEKRSKRETKYMGVPKETREAMQYASDDLNQLGPLYESGYPSYGENEYPPEKVGLHDQSAILTGGLEAEYLQNDGTPRLWNNHRDSDTSRPRTPPSKKLDISRFVTLPPPYPRHYPAVQNHHPDLVEYRTHVRVVNNPEELKARKQHFHESAVAKQTSNKDKMIQNRKEFRARLSREIEDGSISFAEAAEAETAFKMDEQTQEKSNLQRRFENYQTEVLDPIQITLQERLSSTTSLVEKLKANLSTDARTQNPNQTVVEEGDEQPELLEKLTMLKWLSEARENLHKELYTLECERSEMYKQLVTLPYKQTNNVMKLRDTERFFESDELMQRAKFETQCYERWKDILETVEVEVGRGVESQLSAFWDIAPGLVELIRKIPAEDGDLSEYPASPTSNTTKQGKWHGIQIPASELSENPSYSHHATQYLYTLLDHAEKSTYQFIESQINLLCLLHEFRCSSLSSHSKSSQANQRLSQFSSNPNTLSPPASSPKQNVLTVEAVKKEKELTADLKSRVRDAEGLWEEALGVELKRVKAGVRAWLERTGGWMDFE